MMLNYQSHIFRKSWGVQEKRKVCIYWIFNYLKCDRVLATFPYWKKISGFSNYKPLKNLNIKVHIDRELSDLTNYFSQSNFAIKYNPYMENIEADCLSQNLILKIMIAKKIVFE